MSSPTSDGLIIDPASFEAYKELREVAKQFNLEDKLEVPQMVIVGETSAGKSMIVQYLLRFPCSFSKSDVATRCPVAYSLRYKPNLRKDERRVIRPSGINDTQLANYLEKLMQRIEVEHAATGGFRLEPEFIEIESSDYTDFEILDLPGFIAGDQQADNRRAVEQVAEQFVRNPRFSVVMVKEATQIAENSNGARTIYDLCTNAYGFDSKLQPRLDYRDKMITIHTKFDSFMLNYTNGTAANDMIQKHINAFGKSFFTNMIFDGYSIKDRNFSENVSYIRNLPRKEQQEVDNWVLRMSRASDGSTQNYETFNPEYRSLIGIDVVRKEIQALWLRSFRAALPKLKTVITEQLEAALAEYQEKKERYKLLNPKLLQDQYLRYLNDFRTTLRQYVGFKAEIDFDFPIDIYGQTYDEMEAHYLKWKRRKPITWRAYLSAAELRTRFEQESSTLGLRLVGGRNFSRLHTVFSCMILGYKGTDPSRDWIETAASHLAANSTDFDDMEKAARDILRTLIRQTFLLGICWLTQMYSYILDTLRINVKRHLLKTEKYSLLRTHYRFLNAVDLEYHTITRSMIQDAVRLIRDIRDSYTAYAHYDITIRMLKLVFSIPPSIKHQKFHERVEGVYIKDQNTNEYVPATLDAIFKSIPPPKLLEHIYGSESFLSEKRDPYTADHHDTQCRAIRELYTATAGRLLQDIQSSFNSNVAMKIHNIDRVDTDQPKEHTDRCPLYLRISRMSDHQTSNMANVNLDDINESCDEAIRKIEHLIKAKALIDRAIEQMNSEKPIKMEQRRETKDSIDALNKKEVQFLREQQEKLEEENQYQLQFQNGNRSVDEPNKTQINSASDDLQELMTANDPTMASIFLYDIYRRHDLEDLVYGFLPGDSLDQDKVNNAAYDHFKFDPDAVCDLDFSSTLSTRDNRRGRTIKSSSSQETFNTSSAQKNTNADPTTSFVTNRNTLTSDEYNVNEA